MPRLKGSTMTMVDSIGLREPESVAEHRGDWGGPLIRVHWAGVALAFEFANIRARDREKEEAWLNALLSALDDAGPKRADILATAGDLTTPMAEGQAFLDLKQQAIHEVVGAAVVRGGRATFALLSSGMGRKENGIDTRPDLVESARENLEAHSTVIKAVDKKVAEIGVATEPSAAR